MTYDVLADVLHHLGRELAARRIDRRDLIECLDSATHPIVGESRPSDADVVRYLSESGITLEAYLDRVQETLAPDA